MLGRPFARSFQHALRASAHCRRLDIYHARPIAFYSTAPPSGSKPPSNAPKKSKQEDLEAEVLATQKQLEEDVAALGDLGLDVEEEFTVDELEELSQDIDFHDATFEATSKEPERLGQNEQELFGTESYPGSEFPYQKSPNDHLPSTPPKIDPRTLPRNIPLEQLGRRPSEENVASLLIHGRSIHLPYFHPRTHGYPAAVIQFRSFEPKLLELFSHFATHAASALGVPCSRVVCLPTQRTLWTVPRSPFVHKKSQENFERKVHKRMIKAWDADEEVIDRWFKYLRKHEMGGVGMRMVKWERLELGIGKKRLAHLKDVVLGAAKENSHIHAEEIKQLGQKIVKEEMTTTAGGTTGKEVVVEAAKST
ncbi:mitochondrial 37S ribosomal protein rsm10 [Stygiomarasmius scandens]|uniref:Mitochondrial 37S ribosomal protein rsm10 n=1 Tax=Marasmiellus scandens TaxID=2682957 RepID=A0ABR1JZ15_9AGAR